MDIDHQRMMLDKPTAIIAPRISLELYQFIAALPEQGITVILVDQNVRSCVRVSDHVYILSSARTVPKAMPGTSPGTARSAR